MSERVSVCVCVRGGCDRLCCGQMWTNEMDRRERAGSRTEQKQIFSLKFTTSYFCQYSPILDPCCHLLHWGVENSHALLARFRVPPQPYESPPVNAVLRSVAVFFGPTQNISSKNFFDTMSGSPWGECTAYVKTLWGGFSS